MLVYVAWFRRRMKIRRRFKNDYLQKIYEHILLNPPYRKDGTPHKGCGWNNWFWWGYLGKPYKLVPPHTSAHACWAAGQDYKRLEGKYGT